MGLFDKELEMLEKFGIFVKYSKEDILSLFNNEF